MRPRHAIPWVLIALVLSPLGLFAWMTLHPEAPWIERAEEWPVVGSWMERFRQAYLSPETPHQEPSDGGDTAEFEIVEVQPPPAGPNAPGVEIVPPIWLEPGMVLHQEPSGTSPELGRITRYEHVVPTSVRGLWRRVEVEGRRGWVYVDRLPAEPGEPLLGREPAPVLPVSARPPDEDTLARARAQLQGESTGVLGPYPLYTDVRDASLRYRLHQVATHLEAVYAERFGVEPVGEPAEAVILFDRLSSYRLFQAADDRLRGLPAAGHAGHGLAALFVESQDPEQVAATLVHELTHLLNRRALGPALPPWLDEGLAEDLTWSRLDDQGRAVPGSWGGVEREHEELVVRFGGAAVRDRYRRAQTLGHLVPLEELFRMEWQDFVRFRGGLAYAQAGLWVRWLLDRAPPGRFHRFLRDTARGERITEERLLETMGLSWEEMEVGLREWVEGG